MAAICMHFDPLSFQPEMMQVFSGTAEARTTTVVGFRFKICVQFQEIIIIRVIRQRKYCATMVKETVQGLGKI